MQLVLLLRQRWLSDAWEDGLDDCKCDMLLRTGAYCVWDDGVEGTLGQSAVADLSAAGAGHAAGLSHGAGREEVLQEELAQGALLP